MNKKTIRITGAQMSFPVGAIQKNKQTILDCFEIAEDKESDILCANNYGCIPLLVKTGYGERTLSSKHCPPKEVGGTLSRQIGKKNEN